MFVARYSRSKLAASTVLGGVLCAGALAIAVQDGPTLERAIASAFGLLMLALVSWVVSRFWTGPLLEIDEDAIRCRTPPIHLRWSEVGSVRLRRVGGYGGRRTYQLVVRPRDPRVLKEQTQGRVRNPMLTARGQAWIPLNFLAVRPLEVAAAITEASGLSVVDVHAKLDPRSWDES